MYLKSISLTNFRKYGIKDDGTPGITVHFNPTFNVLVGENDSGKTAIVDAIRYLLGSVSDDFIKINQDDFFSYSKDKYCDSFYIEGTFADLTEKEAGAFLEWLSFNEDNEYQLRVSLQVERKTNDNGQEYIDRKVYAGEQNYESRLNSHARNILKTTYLKPLRDAKSELKPGFRSRLAHILKAHPAFKNTSNNSLHPLEKMMEEANNNVEGYFEQDYTEGHSLVSDVEKLLRNFHDKTDQSKSKSKFSVTSTDLLSILRKLSLDTEDVNLGLGNLNLLFIATEMLLLNNYVQEESIGPHITLIEEIEAHLHTQAQIRLIKFLEKELETETNNSQFILTSHSPNLVSSIDPKNIILIHKKVAYPFREEYTELNKEDFAFLERFLDSTKSNLFFAKGIIFVEGDSEMLLLPAFANLINYPLHEHGISLVNVRGTSFERYIKLFSRTEKWKRKMSLPPISMPISMVTDLDVKPLIYYDYESKDKFLYSIKNKKELDEVLLHCKEGKEDIIEDHIELEYSTLKKLAKGFGFTLNESNKDSISQIVKKRITERSINLMSVDKRNKLNEQYANYDANLEICIAPEWTLEYSLALSVLAPLLLKSIHEVRYKGPYTGKKKEAFDNLMKQLDGSWDEAIAYEIFKPVNDNNVSKAEVAQNLAVKINEIAKDEKECENWKALIMSDDNLQYLIKAITHTAGGAK